MRDSTIDFNSISRALSGTIEALESAGDPSALEQLTDAQEELKRALSFSLSHMNGHELTED
ncbi:hypothetical protein [Bacillus dakarensis]|uniref:hypothetical protein n=1 Tax=Robertmurraya dakarensis TaxID=1926278 RepID=UPI000981FAE9|nr:hypothetical protein [Bacillus dakarensis]